MDSNFTRRRFLESSAVLLGVSILGGCHGGTADSPKSSTNSDGTITVTGVGSLKNGQGIPFLFPNGEPGIYFVSRYGQHGAVSAKCTHLGCTVLWNDDEDPRVPLRCPCHESHFSLEGQVRQGPAKKPLSRYVVTQQGDKAILTLV